MCHLTKAVEGIAQQGLETLKHRQSAEEKPQDGLSRNQAALDRVCRVAVKNLVLSQEDKPKRHRSAR